MFQAFYSSTVKAEVDVMYPQGSRSTVCAGEVKMNASSVILSSLQSFTVKVNVQVLSPIKQFDVESHFALIKIFQYKMIQVDLQ